MTLKRKRSTSMLHSPYTSQTAGSLMSSSSPTHALAARGRPSDGTSPISDDTSIDVDMTMTVDDERARTTMFDVTPPHLNSRSRKRWRDGRPADDVVHEYTLRVLFAAQTRPSQLRMPSCGSGLGETGRTSTPNPAPSPVQKTSLHAFWDLPPPPPEQVLSRPTRNDFGELRCEDCDGPLSDCVDLGGAISAMAESLYEDARCHRCGRPVCATCTVDGPQRSCLDCAARRGYRHGMIRDRG
ncbi:MAG: hypothetical protein M1833_005676 [Piccolia ochrophora]|nr:MAG: hypothetical protein M1833_005676 [Piccolia ochrophora]